MKMKGIIWLISINMFFLYACSKDNNGNNNGGGTLLQA